MSQERPAKNFSVRTQPQPSKWTTLYLTCVRLYLQLRLYKAQLKLHEVRFLLPDPVFSVAQSELLLPEPCPGLVSPLQVCFCCVRRRWKVKSMQSVLHFLNLIFDDSDARLHLRQPLPELLQLAIKKPWSLAITTHAVRLTSDWPAAREASTVEGKQLHVSLLQTDSYTHPTAPTHQVMVEKFLAP